MKNWLRGKAADFVRDVLLSHLAKERGIFQSEELERLLNIHNEGQRDFSTQIWAVAFFELWCEHWLDHSALALRDTSQNTVLGIPAISR